MPASTGFELEPLTTAIGSVVHGLDLRQPLAAETVSALRAALVERGVLFLRDQPLDEAGYWAFAARLGVPLKDETTGTPENRADDLMTADFSRSRHATSVWHADTTSLAAPPWATLLRAVDPPPFGGDTCWSSMYAAWEALSPPMQAMLEGLHAVHSIQPTYDRMGAYAPSYEAQYAPRHVKEQVHPVMLRHPETGRKALYVSESFCTRIVELDRLESAALLAFLFRHVERPDFGLRWKWRASDLAIWDNRCVQHYAVPDYERSRVMQRIVLQGERPGGG